MNRERTESYRDHTVRIVVLRPSGRETSFRAIYEIRRPETNEHEPRRGVVAGALRTWADAEEAALKAAALAIDSSR